ncbi:MAG: 50S ribosomal protein L30 [Deltaproteobacteria bacterium RIFOXYA12_FULL_61_11]|nr:MAG: 50S ribosomal protein L30 [Deltaproteobacteria bacterium RIFOXYA12_FULL_61_11]
MSKLEVRLKRSLIGSPDPIRRTVAALGLHKREDTNIHDDNKVVRGMIQKVIHLVEVRKLDDAQA